jgi:hypothetical protein
MSLSFELRATSQIGFQLEARGSRLEALCGTLVARSCEVTK